MSRSIKWFPAGVDPQRSDGNEIVLQGEDSPFSELVGASGYGAPEYEALWWRTPGVVGGQLNTVAIGIGRETWRFLLAADTPAEFRAWYRDLVSATDPRKGVGTFQVGHDLGTDAAVLRQIKALVVGGLQGDPVFARGEDVCEWPFDLELETPSPFWHSAEPAVATWKGKAHPPLFGTSFFGWTLAPQGMEVVDLLELDGDADCWPSFNLTGPFTRARFTNTGTGEWWEVQRGGDDASVGLRVETLPGSREIVTTDGASALWQRSVGSQFFALRTDDMVTVEADGTSAATFFEMTAWPTWNTAP